MSLFIAEKGHSQYEELSDLHLGKDFSRFIPQKSFCPKLISIFDFAKSKYLRFRAETQIYAGGNYPYFAVQNFGSK
jgi:hypothetical protein